MWGNVGDGRSFIQSNEKISGVLFVLSFFLTPTEMNVDL